MTEEGVTKEADANPQKGRPPDENLRIMGKKIDALEADKAKLAEKLAEYDKRFQAFSGQSEPAEDDEFTFLSKREFKDSFQREREALKKEVREELEKETFQRKNDMFFQQFPDYNQVVTEENVKKLEEYDPNFASVLALVPDKLAQYKAAYGKVKEMQERTAKKSTAPHPYTAVSPFGMGSTPNVMGAERMTDPNARMEARKLLNDMKKGFIK